MHLASVNDAGQPVAGRLVLEPARTLYAYPQVHYRFWQTVRAQARVAAWDEVLAPGALGEQLTLSGLDESDLWVGDRLVLPGCVLAVRGPRLPGPELGAQLGFAQAIKLCAQSGYCGAFLAVVEAGDVGAGDALRLVPGPREVNVRELFRARVGTG